jgi:hypothetical protein
MPGARLRPFVVIGTPLTSAPLDPSAAIELADTDKGFLPNRLTTAQRDAIKDPPNGLLIWNTETVQYEGYNGSAWVAIGGSGLSNPFTDSALALWASDPTSGLGFDASGLPQLVDGPDGVTANFLSNSGGGNNNPGLVIGQVSADAYPGLTIGPQGANSAGGSFLTLLHFGDSGNNIYFAGAEGSVNAPTATIMDRYLGEIQMYGYGATDYTTNTVGNGFQMFARAAEQFDDTHGAVNVFFQTIDLVTEGAGPNTRILLDGYGNTKQQNGVFALDTAGNDAGITIASLPGSPTLGMMAVVNNALAPALGVTVASGGTAKAVVWWNGANWTVVAK